MVERLSSGTSGHLGCFTKEQLLAIQKKEADTNADLQASLAALEVAMVTAKDEAFGEAIKDVKKL